MTRVAGAKDLTLSCTAQEAHTCPVHTDSLSSTNALSNSHVCWDCWVRARQVLVEEKGDVAPQCMGQQDYPARATEDAPW